MATAFVDADILVYRCAFAAQKPLYRVFNKQTKALIGEFKRAYDLVDDDPDSEEPKVIVDPGWRDEVKRLDIADSIEVVKDWELQPVSHALQALKSCIESIEYTCKCDKYIYYLSGKDNFRNERATIMEYKGNRDKDDRPVYYPDVRKHLVEVYEAVVVDGWEADDEIVHQYALGTNDDDVIVTIDKDLRQCAGKFYDWVKQEFVWIPVPQADRHFFAQVLTGDRTDNIPGIPGIGEKKAEVILGPDNDFERMQKAVEETYREFYEENPKGVAMANELGMTWEEILYEVEDLIRIGRPN